jgi:hypothetical protein
VTVTRVAAKEAPKRRAPKPVSNPKTSLTGNVPKGPVAAPAKRRCSRSFALSPMSGSRCVQFCDAMSRELVSVPN